MKKFNKRKCYNCQEAIVIKGPGDDGARRPDKQYECTSKYVPPQFIDKHNENYDVMAEHCKYFKSIRFRNMCPICNEEYEGEVEGWEFFIEDEDLDGTVIVQRVCSQECVDEARFGLDNFDEEEFEMEEVDNTEIGEEELPF